MIDKLKRAIGMAWATPVGRTFLQAALPIIVAAGTGWVDASLWKAAVLAGVAAVFAKGQESVRG